MSNRRPWLFLIALALLSPIDRVGRHHGVSSARPHAGESRDDGIWYRCGAGDRRVRVRVRARPRESRGAGAERADLHVQRAAADTGADRGDAVLRDGGRRRRITRRSTRISETNVGINVGGGVKVNLAGPLRLRLDYRDLHAAGQSAPREAAALLRGCESEVLSREMSHHRVSSLTLWCASVWRLPYLTGVRFSLLYRRGERGGEFLEHLLGLGRPQLVRRHHGLHQREELVLALRAGDGIERATTYKAFAPISSVAL